jgi:hypothetical protein
MEGSGAVEEWVLIERGMIAEVGCLFLFNSSFLLSLPSPLPSF